VWDVNVIETAMKDFYDNDLSTMIQAIQQNITVSTSASITCFCLVNTGEKQVFDWVLVVQEEWANEEKQWETCRSQTKTCADK